MSLLGGRQGVNMKNALLWIAAILMVVFALPNASRSGEPDCPPKRSPSARRRPAVHTTIMARDSLAC